MAIFLVYIHSSIILALIPDQIVLRARKRYALTRKSIFWKRAEVCSPTHSRLTSNFKSAHLKQQKKRSQKQVSFWAAKIRKQHKWVRCFTMRSIISIVYIQFVHEFSVCSRQDFAREMHTRIFTCDFSLDQVFLDGMCFVYRWRPLCRLYPIKNCVRL